MNQSAHRVGSNQAQRPKHQQNYEDGPKHILVLLFETAIPILPLGN
jgi:hypothetical protein